MRFFASLFALVYFASGVILDEYKDLLLVAGDIHCNPCLTSIGHLTVAEIIKCLDRVPVTCNYRLDIGKITGDATTICGSNYGFNVGDITATIPTATMTGMRGTATINTNLEVDACTYDVYTSPTESCVMTPNGTAVTTVAVSNGTGSLDLAKIKEMNISLKEPETEGCGTKITKVTYETGVSATLLVTGTLATTSTALQTTTTSTEPVSTEDSSPQFDISIIILLSWSLCTLLEEW